MSAAARVGDAMNGRERKGPRRAAGARRVARTAQGRKGQQDRRGPQRAAGAPRAATGSSRQNLPLLRRTLKAFLRDLHGLADLHVLNETLTFREEYTGERLYDNGAQHRADIALRFYDKVRRVIA